MIKVPIKKGTASSIMKPLSSDLNEMLTKQISGRKYSYRKNYKCKVHEVGYLRTPR